MTEPVGTFYGTAFAPDGSKLHTSVGAWNENQYWNDACWNRCVPRDCGGLWYLDVGCAEGNYLLRFEQRGGLAVGVNPHLHGDILTPDYFDLGNEHSSPMYRQLKELWGGMYKVVVGGFNSTGDIVPPIPGTFDIVSCLNVLEYMDNPQDCLRSLFRYATDRVLIATDVVHEGETGPTSEALLKQVFLLDELISWCPWPCVVFNHVVPCDGRDWPQAFICSTNPESRLPKVDDSEIIYDREMKLTETQRFWINLHP